MPSSTSGGADWQPEILNPRVVRERFSALKDKRVSVGLVSNHYLVGTWKSVDAHEARFSIGGREMTVKLVDVTALNEAVPLAAEFFK
jgi:hypothetical protein